MPWPFGGSVLENDRTVPPERMLWWHSLAFIGIRWRHNVRDGRIHGPVREQADS